VNPGGFLSRLNLSVNARRSKALNPEMALGLMKKFLKADIFQHRVAQHEKSSVKVSL